MRNTGHGRIRPMRRFQAASQFGRTLAVRSLVLSCVMFCIPLSSHVVQDNSLPVGMVVARVCAPGEQTWNAKRAHRAALTAGPVGLRIACIAPRVLNRLNFACEIRP